MRKTGFRVFLVTVLISVLVISSASIVSAAPTLKTSIQITYIGPHTQNNDYDSVAFEFNWSKLGPTYAYHIQLSDENGSIIAERSVDLCAIYNLTKPVHSWAGNDLFIGLDLQTDTTYKIEIWVEGKGGRQTQNGFVGYAFNEVAY